MTERTRNSAALQVLVTGGTGTLGQLVVPRLRDAACDVRVLSRGRHEPVHGVEFVTGDLATGDGIAPAVEGIDVIVHCAGSAKGDEQKMRHLVEAASRAAVRHVVYISVVGADRVPIEGRIDRAMFRYFEEKRGAEEVLADSGIAWTTMRATQFHDLSLKTAEQMAKSPLIPVPSGFKFQPIDTDEVAARLVELALGEPAGLVPDIAGPEVYSMADLVRSYLRASGKHRLMLPIRLPGRAARAFRAGVNLAPERAVGRRTWEEFLAVRLRSTRDNNPVHAA